jgi:uncharacterized protein (TIGR01244 family)
MAQIRKVTDAFAVSPQISVDDVRSIADQGFVLVINNRPDGEAADQPTSAEIAAAASAAGIAYRHLPVVGRATTEQVRATREAIADAQGKALAFCRSGTRSITTWALAQAAAGEKTQEELVSLARAAGYDLSAVL